MRFDLCCGSGWHVAGEGLLGALRMSPEFYDSIPQARAPALHERFKERFSAAWHRTKCRDPSSPLLPFSFAQDRSDSVRMTVVKPPRPS
jgi:hypothetical protein